MIPEVGSTCLFTFLVKFSALNGVYRIRSETTFKDAVLAKVNFVDNLYTPLGLTQSDYNADYQGYLGDRVAVLESVRDSNAVYYVPESAFLNVPDPTINEYLSLNLVINLGVHQNTQVIFPVIDQIKDIVQSSLGIESPLYLTANPDNKVYMTDQQYQALEVARAENITRLIPLSTQLANAQRQITALAAKLQAYEERIAQQATETP